MRATVLEVPACWGARDHVLERVDRALAAGPATDLVLLPEAALSGYVSPEGDFDASVFAERADGPTRALVADLARRHRAFFVAPLVLADGRARYNAMIGVDAAGALVFVYRKRHPWFPETWATSGAEAMPLVHVGGVAITIAICFDGHFLEVEAPEALGRADLLLFPSAWVDTEESRLPLLRALARGFGVVVANANWAAGVVALPGQGGSCFVDREGEVVARAEPADGAPEIGRADLVVHRR